MNIEMYRKRVFVWQRNVAGQPVVSDPSLADWGFVGKQVGYVVEEWFRETVPAIRCFGSSLVEVFGSTNANAIEKDRIAVIDGVADTAFTALGVMNASGLLGVYDDGFGPEFVVRPRLNIATAVILAGEAINSLATKLNKERENFMIGGCMNDIFRALYTCSALVDADFEEALIEVCRSNESKLWKADEINKGREDGSFDDGKWEVKAVRLGEFRVNDRSTRKLIKSPGYSKADFRKALSKSLDLR